MLYITVSPSIPHFPVNDSISQAGVAQDVNKLPFFNAFSALLSSVRDGVKLILWRKSEIQRSKRLDWSCQVDSRQMMAFNRFFYWSEKNSKTINKLLTLLLFECRRRLVKNATLLINQLNLGINMETQKLGTKTGSGFSFCGFHTFYRGKKFPQLISLISKANKSRVLFKPNRRNSCTEYNKQNGDFRFV